MTNVYVVCDPLGRVLTPTAAGNVQQAQQHFFRMYGYSRTWKEAELQGFDVVELTPA